MLVLTWTRVLFAVAPSIGGVLCLYQGKNQKLDEYIQGYRENWRLMHLLVYRSVRSLWRVYSRVHMRVLLWYVLQLTSHSSWQNHLSVSKHLPVVSIYGRSPHVELSHVCVSVTQVMYVALYGTCVSAKFSSGNNKQQDGLLHQGRFSSHASPWPSLSDQTHWVNFEPTNRRVV